MAIYTIAHYQVNPRAIDKVKRQLKNLSAMSRQTNPAPGRMRHGSRKTPQPVSYISSFLPTKPRMPFMANRRP
jgi:hypothetical protein